MFQAGTLIDQSGLAKNTFKILGRTSRVLWSTPMDAAAWQNFAITMDFGMK